MSVRCWFSLPALSVHGHNPIKCPYWWINRGFSTLPDTHSPWSYSHYCYPSAQSTFFMSHNILLWQFFLLKVDLGVLCNWDTNVCRRGESCLGCSCRACILVMLLTLIFLRNMRGENSTVLSRTQHKLFCAALPEAFSVKLGRPSLLCVLRINPCSWNNSFFCHICELPHPHFHRCN